MEEHQEHIRALLEPLDDRPSQILLPRAAVGRTLAENVYSPIDLPVFRNSAMDGYAVAAESLAVLPARLTVLGIVGAGADYGDPVPAGAAVKLMTGAPLPPNTDCVVPVEDTDTDGAAVIIRTPRSAGDFVREPGTDIRRGMLLARAGTVLEPKHAAALAAAGVAGVPVRRRIDAAVITTGNELIRPGLELGPGQIYDSNGVALATALEANGTQVRMVAHSSDDPNEFRRLLDVAFDSAQVVFTTGGISMGDFEVVRQTLSPLGGEFGHVAVQPGGPQGTTVINGVPVLSFPGNPVSALVSFHVFAREVLRDLAGLAEIGPRTLPVGTVLRSPAGKRQFQRGRLVDGGVEPVAGPGSHLIATMARADVLIDIPAETTSVPAGADVRVWPI